MESSPLRKEAICVHDVENAIKSFASIGSSRIVCFTGGEPFLPSLNLANHLALCRQQGLSSYVITSGYWAQTFEGAMNTLKRVEPISLLCVSADKYHLPFVPLENIVNACSAACKLNIDVSLTVTVNDLDGDPFLQDLKSKLGDLCESIDIYLTVIDAVGRSDESGRNCFSSADAGACPSLGSPVITVDGSICACCQVSETNNISQSGNYSHALRLGCAQSMDIADAKKIVEDDVLFRGLRTLGPKWIAQQISEQGIDVDIFSKQASSMCHFCSRITRSKRNSAIAREVLSQDKTQVLMRYIEETRASPVNYNSPFSRLYPAFTEP